MYFQFRFVTSSSGSSVFFVVVGFLCYLDCGAAWFTYCHRNLRHKDVLLSGALGLCALFIVWS